VAPQAVSLTADKPGVLCYNPCLSALLCTTQGSCNELDAEGGDGSGSLALYSCPVGPTCVARSRHQLVGFNWQAHTFDSVWQVGTPQNGTAH
jgi:hypothetical protein